MLLDGDHDVFGDASVAFVKLAKFGPLVLSGDLYGIFGPSSEPQLASNTVSTSE